MKLDRYQEACDRATDSQGLTPVVEALTEANVPFVVEQTGGFTMVLYIGNGGTTHLGVTENLPDEYMICEYQGNGEYDDEGEKLIASDLTLDGLVAYATAFLTR